MDPTCVPVVPAGGPWQLRTEGREQVEEGPGDDNDVGGGAEGNDQVTGVAHACTK